MTSSVDFFILPPTINCKWLSVIMYIDILFNSLYHATAKGKLQMKIATSSLYETFLI